MRSLDAPGASVRALPLFLILVAVTLAGCGQSRLALPANGDKPTYVLLITAAHPYADAAQVRLALDNTEINRQTGQVVEHPETMRVLSPAERATFESGLHRERLIGVPPPELATPACFIPHHFFRYYSATGQQVGEIKVCFCCGGYEATPRLPYGNGRGDQRDEFKVNLTQTKAFVRGLGLRTDMMCD